MPPTEHVLIHELSHEGARVIAMSAVGTSTWWFVVKGEVNRKQLVAASKALHQIIDVYEDAPDTPVSDGDK